MAQLENVIRPFVGQDVTPQRLLPRNGHSSPPVRLAVGIIGGTKTFSFSGSSTISSYMAQVNTEKPSDAFDMSTGSLAS